LNFNRFSQKYSVYFPFAYCSISSFKKAGILLFGLLGSEVHRIFCYIHKTNFCCQKPAFILNHNLSLGFLPKDKTIITTEKAIKKREHHLLTA